MTKEQSLVYYKSLLSDTESIKESLDEAMKEETTQKYYINKTLNLLTKMRENLNTLKENL